MSETIFGHRFVSTFRSIYTNPDGKPRNVDQFKRIMAPHTFRVTKDEALDLPPKISERFYFDLGPKARSASATAPANLRGSFG